MTAHSSLKLVQESLFDGTYEVLHAVGRGQNSVVYKARKVRGAFSGKLVALKVLLGNKDPSLHYKRMKREALAMLSSIHPNVVKLIDYVATDETCYLSMEFAERGDLRLLLEAQRMVFTPELVLRLMIQILGGLQAIHRVGIIHRDIKPENLLLTADCKIKIADFGIACLPSEQVSKEEANRGIGTFDYLSPESLEEGISNEATDVYSAAVTCYQLLTGHLPFAGASFTEQIVNKMEGAVLPLQSFMKEVPHLLQEFVEQSLAAEPEDRYQSAEEFCCAIKSFVDGSWAPSPAKRPLEKHLDTIRNLREAEHNGGTGQTVLTLPDERDLLLLPEEKNEIESAEVVPDDGPSFSVKHIIFRLFAALIVGALIGGAWTVLQPYYFPSLSVAGDDTKQPVVETIETKKSSAVPFSVLLGGQHVGRIYGLSEEDPDKPLRFVTLPSPDEEGINVVFGLKDWGSVFVPKHKLLYSHSLELEGAGLKLLFVSENNSAENSYTIGGRYLEHNSKKSGKWFLW